jgi:hypothetical protein
VFTNLGEILVLFAEEMRADEPCAHCRAIFWRHGWSVVERDGSDQEIVPVMPTCPDGSGRTYKRQ